MNQQAGGGASAAPNLDEALERHARLFEDAFGAGAPVRSFFSPGRVNLMGAHLDYNGGPVMPMAIDRGTFLAMRERRDTRVRLRSTMEGSETSFEVHAPPTVRAGGWSDYPCGVFRGFSRIAAQNGKSLRRGVDVLFGGNLPVGAGLSSSASICVGTAFALDRMWEFGLEPLDRVRIALEAEREFVGVHCGIMDPYAVGLARPGHLLWLDCKDATFEHLPLDHRRVRVAVADTGVRRELAQSAFNVRVAEAGRAFERLRRHAPGATCLRDVPLATLEQHGSELEPVLRARARHVLEEVRRTFEARECLRRGDLAGFGARMFETHDSLREFYEVSVPELDVLVGASRAHASVYGARLTGAGFGGCVVILLGEDARAGVTSAIAAEFETRFGRRPRIELFGGDAGPRELAG